MTSLCPDLVTEADEDDGVLDLQVVQLRREADDVLSLELSDPEGGVLPGWAPGAHIDLRIGDAIRQFSLCGNPRDPFTYRVAVLRETLSRGGSRFVHEQLRPGDLVEVGGPRNHFQLDEHASYRFITGGIGITPILTMVREVADRGLPWRLVYGGRRLSAMAFREELASHGGAVHLVPEDRVGRIDLPTALGPVRDDTGIYCCGPEGLIAAVEEQSTHWPQGALHVERFRARPQSGQRADRTFTVECSRSGLEVTVAPGESLLDRLEANGVAVATACREGICGSCELPVLAGAIEHRDSVLSAAERSRGDRVMACVSRAGGDRLVLDL